LKSASESGNSVNICLGYEDLCGEDIIALAKSQVHRMTKAYENGT